MNSERLIRIIAGSFILLSVLLASIYNGANLLVPTWHWVTVFVGLNLLQSGISRWCLMERIMMKLGVKSGCVEAQNQC